MKLLKRVHKAINYGPGILVLTMLSWSVFTVWLVGSTPTFIAFLGNAIVFMSVYASSSISLAIYQVYREGPDRRDDHRYLFCAEKPESIEPQEEPKELPSVVQFDAVRTYAPTYNLEALRAFEAEYPGYKTIVVWDVDSSILMAHRGPNEREISKWIGP